MPKWAGAAIFEAPLGARDVMDIGGLLVTTSERTALDCARHLSPPMALAVLDRMAWLCAHRLLVTLENGSTEQFRPTPRARRDRPAPVPVGDNRAAVYLLTEALPEELAEASPVEGASSPPTSADVRPLRHETPRTTPVVQ